MSCINNYYIADFTQGLEQHQDISLDRYIQHGNRLIRNQQFQFHHQSAGDHHTLALAAGQIIWIAVPELLSWCQAAVFHGSANTFFFHFCVQTQVMDLQRFAYDFKNGLARIDRLAGILKDHLRLIAQGEDLLALVKVSDPGFIIPFGNQLAVRSVEHVLSIKQDAAAGGPLQTQHVHAQGGFSGTRFTHQTRHLTFFDD